MFECKLVIACACAYVSVIACACACVYVCACMRGGDGSYIAVTHSTSSSTHNNSCFASTNSCQCTTLGNTRSKLHKKLKRTAPVKFSTSEHFPAWRINACRHEAIPPTVPTTGRVNSNKYPPPTPKPHPNPPTPHTHPTATPTAPKQGIILCENETSSSVGHTQCQCHFIIVAMSVTV